MAEIKITSEKKISEPEKQITAVLYSYLREDTDEFFYPVIGFQR